MHALRKWSMAAPVGAAAVLTVGVVAAALAAPAPKPSAPEWERDVLPILKARCLKCHGGSAQLGRLDLRTPAALQKGGAGGHVVVRNKPESSPLYQRVADRTMPPGNEKKLTDAEIATIRAWIATGANTTQPQATGPATPNAQRPTPTTHWAYVSPKRPAIPRVRQRAWVRTPIDNFTLARLEAAGIRPPKPADRRTLLRRLYLDLIGLPPTPEEMARFLKDCAEEDHAAQIVGRKPSGPALPLTKGELEGVSPGPRALTPRAQRVNPTSAASKPHKRQLVGPRAGSAYERVVDDLLSRPQYGERWARRWLDVARYAESNGYERDGAKPQAWRYRDYVIDSLNRDKPFDRFLIEQLAGDEIPGTNAETQTATTFLRLGTWDDEPAEPELDRYDQLDDVLGTSTAAFLGITLRCARCHDHKFEPFSQKEYYQVLSVFQPLKRPQDGRTDLDRLLGTPEELKAYHEALARVEARRGTLRNELDEVQRPIRERLFAQGASKLPPEVIAAFRAEPGTRTPPQKELVRKHTAALDNEVLAASGDLRDRIGGLLQQLAAVEATRPVEPPRGYIWYEDTPVAPPTRLLARGEPHQPGAEVQPGVPAVLAAAPGAPPQPTATSTGRRLWLARWMARPEHPLTARVIVNRIWQGHFGEGLVASENDFGVMGQLPTHPELLDYLAVTFAAEAGAGTATTVTTATSGSKDSGSPRIGGRGAGSASSFIPQPSSFAPQAQRPTPNASPQGMGWSLKRLHRMIVLSSTYQASADWDAASARKDPDDLLFWRWRPRRLDAEAVRDSILAVSGQLDPQMGGPSVYPTIPRAVLAGQSRPGDGWGRSDERQASRRSVYIFSKRSLVVPELEILDAPDTTSSCEQRPVSTIAPQALTFLNGEFIQQQSAHFAARLLKEAGATSRAQVERGFLLACGRPASAVEREALLQFLAAQEIQVKSDLEKAGQPADKARRQALEALCLVLLNANEFVYQR